MLGVASLPLTLVIRSTRFRNNDGESSQARNRFDYAHDRFSNGKSQIPNFDAFAFSAQIAMAAS
jgi:hypothetical protein